MGSTISSCLQSKEKQPNFLKGKVMMKQNDAIRLKRQGIIQLNQLAGHPNYSPKLDSWVAVDRQASDQVYVFSYRHEDGVFGSTVGLGDRYMSKNYTWALDVMEQKYLVAEKNSDTSSVPMAWVDIMCTCHDGETLQEAFGYMGDLYLNNTVINNYMMTPKTFMDVQTRGWIYQESAFPSIELQNDWNDEAWNDLAYYRIVADLILRRGYQAVIKKKALDVDSLSDQMNSIISKGKDTTEMSSTPANGEWWENVVKYKEMICDPEGLGIVLDLHGINELLNEADLNSISSQTIQELRDVVQQSYGKIVAELKSSLSIKATSMMLKYFSVSAIKAFLNSELSVESDRVDAIFGVLKAIDGWPDDLKDKKDDDILHCIWTLAYQTGEIFASAVRSKEQCLAGLKKVTVMEGESITPHIPHLSKFVPDVEDSTSCLYLGSFTKPDSDMEFCIEVFADKDEIVRAIRVIPETYWNYKDVKSKLPVGSETREFIE